MIILTIISNIIISILIIANMTIDIMILLKIYFEKIKIIRQALSKMARGSRRFK